MEEKNPGLRDRLVLDLQEFNRIYPPKCLEVLQEMVGVTTNRLHGLSPIFVETLPISTFPV